MGGFSVATYNSIDLVHDADARLERQLADAGLDRSTLFEEIAPLFLEEEKAGRQYATCLIHRHFSLNEGERMVARGDSTTPSTDISSNIVPESWFTNGEEIEHRMIDGNTILQPPPSPDFLKRFKDIVEKHGIDVLGVCYAPPVADLEPGQKFSEREGRPGYREQVLSKVLESSLNPTTSYQAVWVAAQDLESGRYAMRYKVCCHGCPP